MMWAACLEVHMEVVLIPKSQPQMERHVKMSVPWCYTYDDFALEQAGFSMSPSNLAEATSQQLLTATVNSPNKHIVYTASLSL